MMKLLQVLATSLLLAADVLVSARPAPSPLDIFRRAPNPGVVYTQCARPGTLALAFDDGPYTYTQKLVDTLNAAGGKATFFFTGTLYGRFPFVSRYLDLDRHGIRCMFVLETT